MTGLKEFSYLLNHLVYLNSENLKIKVESCSFNIIFEISKYTVTYFHDTGSLHCLIHY